MKTRSAYFLFATILFGLIMYRMYTNQAKAQAQQEKNSQLVNAFYEHDIPEIERILEQQPQLVNEFIRWQSQTPLMVTILENPEDALDMVFATILENSELAINKKTPNGKTALMFAAQYVADRSRQGKAPSMVQLLLEHGADPWIADDDNNTALSLVYQLYYARIQSQQYACDNGGCISNQSGIETDDYKAIIKLLLTSMATKQPQKVGTLIAHVNEQYTKELQTIMHDLYIEYPEL